jgi:predicted ArsR family transcriptional regulator
MGTWIDPNCELPIFMCARARKNDPATSKKAAAAAPVRSHREKILHALALGPAGASEIGARCGLLTHEVGKRLPDLARDGLAELTGREVQGLSGCLEREWRLSR